MSSHSAAILATLVYAVVVTPLAVAGLFCWVAARARRRAKLGVRFDASPVPRNDWARLDPPAYRRTSKRHTGSRRAGS